MKSVDRITEGIVKTVDLLDRAEAELLRLVIDEPDELVRINRARRARAGLIARLDRLTQPGDSLPIRVAC